MPEQEQDQYTSIARTSVILDVSEQTVRNWIRDGILPAHRFGDRLIRIRLADIHAMAEPVIPPAQVGSPYASQPVR